MMRSSLTTLLKAVVIAGACMAMAGCTHALTCKNLSAYRSDALGTVNRQLTIGIVPTGGDEYGEQLIRHVRDSLILKYNAKVVLPYLPGTSEPVDVIAMLSVKPDYKGSGWNFLVNFPGFLVFAPAWNGYVYEVTYDTTVALQKASDNKTIGTLQTPIKLNLRHASYNRTWTELSWLEWGVIAFVGGIAFTRYDTSVSPVVMKEVGPQLGEYLATEIVNRINKSGEFVFRISPRDENSLTAYDRALLSQG